jgi:hypothetical protein
MHEKAGARKARPKAPLIDVAAARTLARLAVERLAVILTDGADDRRKVDVRLVDDRGRPLVAKGQPITRALLRTLPQRHWAELQLAPMRDDDTTQIVQLTYALAELLRLARQDVVQEAIDSGEARI